MRGVRKSHLDLTPLLDIVLLLLFLFLMMAASQQEEQQKELANQTDSYNSLEQSLEEQIKQLEDEVAILNESLLQKEKEAEELNGELEVKDEALEAINKAIAEFLEINQDELIAIARTENQSSIEGLLDELVDKDLVGESLLKYEALKSEFYFIDIEIKGSGNRLYINNQPTAKGISLDEVSTKDQKEEKIDAVMALIEETIDDRQGGAAMIFVTLKVYDQDVYQYAWNIVWEAIGKLQVKYGTEKLFRTHITLID